LFFFFSSRRRHTRSKRDWSSDVCSSDLFDVVRVPAEQSLGDYLNSGWMEGVEKSSTEDLNINGFPAASATAHGDQWQFKVYALRSEERRVGKEGRAPGAAERDKKKDRIA